MPLLNVFSSAPALDSDKANALLKMLSRTLASELDKPEAYVMTSLVREAQMTFAGTSAPACYAELKNIGELTPALSEHLSALLCRLLSEGLGVAHNRIYIEFSSPEPHAFGFDGGTFA